MIRYGKKEASDKKKVYITEILLGFILVCFSVCAVLARLGVNTYFPNWVYSSGMMQLILLLVGILFISHGTRHWHHTDGKVNIGLGVVLMMFGMLPLFNNLGLLTFLPIIIVLKASPVVLAILLLFSGIYLVVDRFILLFS
jgi:threonine/homoserine/homoserine lactone efflux protein